jgi:hypothetical protein
MLEHSGDSEVSDFNLVVLGHENVLSFEIPVQDLPVVDVLDCQGHLDEPIEDLVLTVTDYNR